jgi:hypothetical protein
MPADASRALFETMLERHVNAVSSWRGMMGVM